jgi:hypothetical protein
MLLVDHPYTPRYLFLNIVNCNVYTFFVIWFICVQASSLCHLTKFCLCVVLLEAPENAECEITFLARHVDASPIPMCRTNAEVHSLGKRLCPVMSIGLF